MASGRQHFAAVHDRDFFVSRKSRAQGQTRTSCDVHINTASRLTFERNLSLNTHREPMLLQMPCVRKFTL
jgi:hypothetical protein